MALWYRVFGGKLDYKKTGDQYKIRNIYHCSLKASSHNTGNI